jgi:uncharacterized protein (TIGR02453 family)
MSGSFTGFTPDAMQFLVDLAFNNERPWFQAHRTEYERLLKEPLEALCADLGDELAKRGVPLGADPKTSPFRIYRDTRFSKDKTPYKTNVAASFPWVGDGVATSDGESKRHGGGYFHMSPEGSYMGGGMWRPEPARLAAYRKQIDEDPEGALGALQDPVFLARFDPVHGDEYKRVPAGYAPDHPHAHLLKLKDVTFGRELTTDEVFSADLPAVLAQDFAAAVPVMRWLASLPVS